MGSNRTYNDVFSSQIVLVLVEGLDLLRIVCLSDQQDILAAAPVLSDYASIHSDPVPLSSAGEFYWKQFLSPDIPFDDCKRGITVSPPSPKQRCLAPIVRLSLLSVSVKGHSPGRISTLAFSISDWHIAHEFFIKVNSTQVMKWLVMAGKNLFFSLAGYLLCFFLQSLFLTDRVAQSLNKIKGEAKRIFLHHRITTNTSEEVTQRCLQTGMKGFIPKPNTLNLNLKQAVINKWEMDDQ